MADVADRVSPIFEELHQRNIEQARCAKNYGLALMIDGHRCCRVCEEPLSKERMKAQPNAVLCVECQEDEERADRLYRR